MKILQVSSHYPPSSTGGAERCVRSLSHALAAAGHEVQVAAPVAPYDDSGVRVQPLPATAPRVAQKVLFDYVSPRATKALLGVIEEFRPDVVHVHNVYGVGSRLIAAASRVAPTVVTMHDYWSMDIVAPRYAGGRLRYPARARLFAPWTKAHCAVHRRHLRDAILTAPSRFLADRVSRALGTRIDIVPNAVDVPDAVSSRERVVLFAGRIVAEKGLDLVLPAAAAAATEHGWRIEVAGDGALAAGLRARFPGVRWHGSTDPAPLYARASILLAPSIWPENAPLSVLEGMSHGLAVLAFAAGGIPEQIDDGVTGFLVTPGEVGAFDGQLRRLMGDAALVARLGDAARKRTDASSWGSIARQYERVYDRAIADTDGAMMQVSAA